MLLSLNFTFLATPAEPHWPSVGTNWIQLHWDWLIKMHCMTCCQLPENGHMLDCCCITHTSDKIWHHWNLIACPS